MNKNLQIATVGGGCFWCTNVGPGGEGVANEPNPEVPYYIYVVFCDPFFHSTSRVRR